MKVGVPKEVKTHEYRVGITPAGVRELVQQGHHLVVEHAAGVGIGSTTMHTAPPAQHPATARTCSPQPI